MYGPLYSVNAYRYWRVSVEGGVVTRLILFMDGVLFVHRGALNVVFQEPIAAPGDPPPPTEEVMAILGPRGANLFDWEGMRSDSCPEARTVMKGEDRQ